MTDSSSHGRVDPAGPDRATGTLEEMVAGVLHQLRVNLDGHHHVVHLSEQGEQRVRAAIDWLLSVQSDDGYWGYRSPAVTAACSVAIALWRPTEAESLLRDAADWLLTYTDDGAWETLWDSAVAVDAVVRAGLGDDARARQAIRRLEGEAPQACTRPHHGAQVLAAAEALDWAPAKRERWSTQVEEHLDLDAGAYVVGQAVYGLLSAGRPVGDLREPLDHLADYLMRTPLSSAALLDHAAALRALARAGTHADVVDRTIDDFFGPAYRRDGSWYHEPWWTAWALLALYEANAVRRVVVEQPRMDDYLAHAEKVVPAIADAERHRAVDAHMARLKVFLATLMLVVGLFASVVVTFLVPDGNPFVASGLGVTMAAAAVAAAWRFLWPLLRPH
jgi:hypothetical protein